MVASEILGIDWRKKVGPLPMYGWGVVVAGGAVGAVLLLRKRSSTSTPTSTASAPMVDTSGAASGNGGGGSGDTPGIDLSPLLAAISQQGQAEQQGFAGILSAEQQGFAQLQTTENQNAQQNQSFLSALVQTLQAGNTAVLNAIASIASNGSTSNPQNTPSSSGVNPGGPMTTTNVGGLSADSGMTLLTNPGGQSYQVPTPVASYYATNPVSSNEIPTNPSVENAVPYNGPGTQGTGGPYWVDIAAPPKQNVA